MHSHEEERERSVKISLNRIKNKIKHMKTCGKQKLSEKMLTNAHHAFRFSSNIQLDTSFKEEKVLLHGSINY